MLCKVKIKNLNKFFNDSLVSDSVNDSLNHNILFYQDIDECNEDSHEYNSVLYGTIYYTYHLLIPDEYVILRSYKMENIHNDMCTHYGQFYFPVKFKVTLGYTYYNSKTEDSFIMWNDITDDSIECYVIDEKKPKQYKLDEDFTFIDNQNRKISYSTIIKSLTHHSHLKYLHIIYEKKLIEIHDKNIQNELKDKYEKNII